MLGDTDEGIWTKLIPKPLTTVRLSWKREMKDLKEERL